MVSAPSTNRRKDSLDNKEFIRTHPTLYEWMPVQPVIICAKKPPFIKSDGKMEEEKKRE